MDRIVEATVTDEPARPADFDLSRAWGEVLGPRPLRAELARIGAELTGRYADGSTAGASPD